MSGYHIPAERHRVELRVSNSRFITTVAPAPTVGEAQAFLGEIRQEMPDATHHVYAFKVGYGTSVSEGMSDDGEPSGTAGPPTLAVLRGAALGDIVLVTTRYFGGTKLGTGGLVSAYTKAAQLALEELPTEEKIERQSFSMHVPYPLFEQTRRLLAEVDAIIDNEAYADDVCVSYRVAADRAAELTRRLEDLSAGQICPHPTD